MKLFFNPSLSVVVFYISVLIFTGCSLNSDSESDQKNPPIAIQGRGEVTKNTKDEKSIVPALLQASSKFSRSEETPIAPDILQISSSDYHSCAVTSLGVKCWGSGNTEIDVPKDLRNPKQVSTSSNYSCAIADGGVTCWGNTRSGQIGFIAKRLIAPTGLKNPSQVSVGIDHACAVTDDGVQCWGESGNGDVSVYERIPDLKNPTQIAVGDKISCAIDDQGLHCWDHIYYSHELFKKDELANLKKPLQISVGPSNFPSGDIHVCVLTIDGIQCFGNKYTAESVPVGLRNPSQVAVGDYHTCALTDDGVQCWKHVEPNWGVVELIVPAGLKNPTQVSVGSEFACALTSEGVVCWGRNDSGELDIPGRFGDCTHQSSIKSEALCAFDQIIFQSANSSIEREHQVLTRLGYQELGASKVTDIKEIVCDSASIEKCSLISLSALYVNDSHFGILKAVLKIRNSKQQIVNRISVESVEPAALNIAAPSYLVGHYSFVGEYQFSDVIEVVEITRSQMNADETLLAQAKANGFDCQNGASRGYYCTRKADSNDARLPNIHKDPRRSITFGPLQSSQGFNYLKGMDLTSQWIEGSAWDKYHQNGLSYLRTNGQATTVKVNYVSWKGGSNTYFTYDAVDTIYYHYKYSMTKQAPMVGLPFWSYLIYSASLKYQKDL